MTTLKDRQVRGDLIEMVETADYKKKMVISGPAASVRGTSLSMRRESFGSRIRKQFLFLDNCKRQFLCEQSDFKLGIHLSHT